MLSNNKTPPLCPPANGHGSRRFICYLAIYFLYFNAIHGIEVAKTRNEGEHPPSNPTGSPFKKVSESWLFFVAEFGAKRTPEGKGIKVFVRVLK